MSGRPRSEPFDWPQYVDRVARVLRRARGPKVVHLSPAMVESLREVDPGALDGIEVREWAPQEHLGVNERTAAGLGYYVLPHEAGLLRLE